MFPLSGTVYAALSFVYPAVLSVHALTALTAMAARRETADGPGPDGVGALPLLLAYWLVRAVVLDAVPWGFVRHIPYEVRTLAVVWLLSPRTRGALVVVSDVLTPAMQRIFPRAALVACSLITYGLTSQWVMDATRAVHTGAAAALRWTAALVLPEDARSAAQDVARAALAVARRASAAVRRALPAVRACIRRLTDALERGDGMDPAAASPTSPPAASAPATPDAAPSPSSGLKTQSDVQRQDKPARSVRARSSAAAKKAHVIAPIASVVKGD